MPDPSEGRADATAAAPVPGAWRAAEAKTARANGTARLGGFLRWFLDRPGRIPLLAGAVAILAYLPAVFNGFAYDDVAIIPDDPRIRGLAILDMLRLPYWRSNPDLAIYRPLTTLSFALDWLISRGQPWFFHAVNVLEHALATVLACSLLAEFFAPAAALIGALVFALHPVHVEAVANVVGRAEVLSGVFYLAALVIWSRADSIRARQVVAVCALYALALLVKESSATLPAALVLVDVARGRLRLRLRALPGYARRALPTLVACAVVLGAFLALRYRVLGLLAPTVVDPIFDTTHTTAGRIFTALQAWPIYLRLTFFPRTLLCDYSPHVVMPATGWTPGAAFGLGILLALLAVGLAAFRRGHGRLALGMLWFPLTVLPVANLLFPIGIMVAERTLYLPVFALSIGVAGAWEWARERGHGARRVIIAAAAIALPLLLVRTLTRIPVWDSTDRVFFALAHDRPDSFRAAWHLARVARREHRGDLAMARYRKAIQLWPYRSYLVTETLAQAMRMRRFGEARELALSAARQWPNDIAIQRDLASAALAAGDSTGARSAAAAGLRLSPGDTALLRISRSLPTPAR